MKRTQIIELLCNIKATFMSFFSIMMFVALSVAIFCGISWTGPALQNAANHVFEEGNLHDFEIIYPYGFTEKNLKELKALDDVDEVEGGYFSFQNVDYKRGYTMKVMSLTQSIDTAVDVKGTLPEKKGEIAVNSVWAEKAGIKVGDRLSFTHDGGAADHDGMRFLQTDTYTVTAIMDSPAYISVTNWSYGIATIGNGTVNCLGWVTEESFDTSAYTGYVQAYIRSDALRQAEPFSQEYDAVSTELNEYLSREGAFLAKKRYQEIQLQAEEKLEEAEVAFLEENYGELVLVLAGFQWIIQHLDPDMQQEIDEAVESALEGVLGEEMMAELEAGRARIEAMQKYDWTILSRNSNGGVQAIQRYSSITGSLRYSMALLFIIIGLLVSYSSVSRIVKDQIVSLGTKKALGLRSREITMSYLAYSGTAVFAGSVIGFLLGTFGVERIIADRLGERFIMGTYASRFVFGEALLLFLVEMALILLTTWFACRSILKLQAVDLLKGPKPPEGKERFFEKWPFWDSLSLMNKTIVNNCFNDKRRVLGTIIGVAGCTALMVTAVTMNDNIQKSFTRQYEEVYHFDTIVRHSAGKIGLQNRIEQKLEKLGASGTPVYTASFGIELPDGKESFATMTVPLDDKTFDALYPALPREERAEAHYQDGIWLNDAYAAHYGARPGDPVTITDSQGQEHTFTIEGFFEHHLISYRMILTKDAYEHVFGKVCRSNALLVDSGDSDAASIRKELKPMAGVTSVKDDYKSSGSTFEEFSQVSGIVIGIYMVLSVLMAIVVLLDLNIVCIEEKKRELIVLMINGFSIKDAKRYVYRDTIALTAIGIICGLILGSIMGNITVISVEPNEASFVKEIDWVACLIGAGSSAVLSAVMSAIALRRIPRFSLTDINKM